MQLFYTFTHSHIHTDMCKCRICLKAEYMEDHPFYVGTDLPPSLWGREEWAAFEEERRAEEDAQDAFDASMYDGIFINVKDNSDDDYDFYDNSDILVNFFLLVGYY